MTDPSVIYKGMKKIKITNEEEALAAMRQDGMLLRFVPPELITEEVCIQAVRQDYRALYYVPEELKTAEVCLEAVANNGRALEYVPPELITVSPKEFGALFEEAMIQEEAGVCVVPEELQKKIRSMLASSPANRENEAG